MNDISHPLEQLRSIDLNLLAVLSAMLEERSVTLAARRLGITQSAASNALRRAREHFGDDLLVRRGREMVPSELARELEPRVRAAMIAAAAALRLPAPFVPAEARAEVRVATSDHIDLVLLEVVRRELSASAPGIQLQVESFSPSSVERCLKDELDWVLAPRDRLPSSLAPITVHQDAFVVGCRKTHAALDRRLTARRFAALQHLVVTPVASERDTQADQALSELGLQRTVVRRVPSFAQALLLLANSDLVAVLPASLLSEHGAVLGLTSVALPFPIDPVALAAGRAPALRTSALHRFMASRFRHAAHSLRRR